MVKFTVIKTGGKQYLVKENDVIYVDNLNINKGKKIDFPALATFDEKGDQVDLGYPLLNKKAQGIVVENLKADKIRVAHFKAKSRYRKVKGYRHQLSKVKIVKI